MAETIPVDPWADRACLLGLYGHWICGLEIPKMKFLTWILVLILFGFVALFAERKIVAKIQSRMGPPLSVAEGIRILSFSPLILVGLIGFIILCPVILSSSSGLLCLILFPFLLSRAVASSQLVLWLAMLPIFLIHPTVDIAEMIQAQDSMSWNLFHNPFTMISGGLFLMILIIQSKIVLKDCSHIFLIKYFIVFLGPLLFTILFMGGMDFTFPLKVLFGFIILLWLSHALPILNEQDYSKFYLDFLTPIAFLNLVGSLSWIALFKGKSLIELIF